MQAAIEKYAINITAACPVLFLLLFHLSWQAAQMANKLSAIHRWCVTGTPVNRGVDGELICYGVRLSASVVAFHVMMLLYYLAYLFHNVHGLSATCM